LLEVLERIGSTPTTIYLLNRLQGITEEEEAVEILDLIQTLPGGKKAIKDFVKTLAKKERKTMNAFFNVAGMTTLGTIAVASITFISAITPLGGGLIIAAAIAWINEKHN